MFASQTQQMNYSFMRHINATPATSVTVFVDFTPLPTASEPMIQLDPPLNQSKYLSNLFQHESLLLTVEPSALQKTSSGYVK